MGGTRDHGRPHRQAAIAGGCGRKVITAYSKEYDFGQRSLIDLLNAENTPFNAQVSLISARSVVVFADYQLLAAMGKLLDYIRAPHPVDAEPLVPGTSASSRSNCRRSSSAFRSPVRSR